MKGMYLFTTTDQRLFWEGKGRLMAFLSLGRNRHEIELFCAYYCPDPVLKAKLQAENKRNRDIECKNGNHVRSFCDDACLFCGAELPKLPEYQWKF